MTHEVQTLARGSLPMMRRLFWFVTGAIAGVTGMSYLRRKAGEIAGKLTPAAVFDALVDVVRVIVRKIFELVKPPQDPPVLP